MTTEKQIIAIAELDGWTKGTFRTFGFGEDGRAMGDLQGWKKNPCNDMRDFTEKLPDYLTSRDAILPVIIKWCDENDQWDCFIENLWDVLKITSDFSEQDAWKLLFKSGIETLSEALLRATGKWSEE